MESFLAPEMKILASYQPFLISLMVVVVVVGDRAPPFPPAWCDSQALYSTLPSLARVELT